MRANAYQQKRRNLRIGMITLAVLPASKCSKLQGLPEYLLIDEPGPSCASQVGGRLYEGEFAAAD